MQHRLKCKKNIYVESSKIEYIFTLIPLQLKNTKLIVPMFNQIRIRSLNYIKPKFDFLNKPVHIEMSYKPISHQICYS